MSKQASLTDQPALAEGSANGGDPSRIERTWVRDLADGQVVEAVFGVRERELRQRRNGGEWLRLIVCDSTGAAEAVVWEEVAECFEIAEPGSAVHITGRFSVHPQYGPKITIETIRSARDDEYEASDLAEGPSVPVERLEAQLRELLATIQNPQLAGTDSWTTRSRSPRR
ncbi:MAG: hypothetical protein E6G48_02555 [Actinobacteria bacterium]|nr:MAG: hypothetical protein E6G48_02555 [Actinomycetota bacterium]